MEAPMTRVYWIGLDVHTAFTEMAVVSASGRLVERRRLATTIPAVQAALAAVPAPKRVTFEEGPLADWLWRELRGAAEEVVVCEPRRNRLISQGDDKDDPVDAAALAQLLRGGYVKAVHHPESRERATFKQHVSWYYDRVRQRVREANRIGAVLRQWGVFVRETEFRTPAARAALMERLPADDLLRQDLAEMWQGYDLVAGQVRASRRRLTARAQAEAVVRRWLAVPGIGWVRAATLFVTLDTPWRFRSKAALWRYLGIGLRRRHTGTGPERLRVPAAVNRRLKATILGAALTAIHRDTPFAARYQRRVANGLAPKLARRTVARDLAAVLWAMWKTGSAYRPEWVGAAVAGRG
jgi:transposase